MSLLWDRILEPEGLSTVFQPVFCVKDGVRSVFGFEALTRGPRGTNIERSDVLFEYVRRKRRESQMDRMAIASALRQARGLPEVPGLCLNVHASTLEEEPRLPAWLGMLAAEYGVPAERIVIEIVEHAPPWAGRHIRRSLDRLRDQGMRIALDDVGLGQSNFRMILDCRPDLLKVDRHFVAGAHRDDDRRAVLESIADLAFRLGGQAVAEGIEDESDLDTVLGAGIELVQGFLLCRPYPSHRLRQMDFLQAPPPDLVPCAASGLFDDPTPTQPIRLPLELD